MLIHCLSLTFDRASNKPNIREDGQKGSHEKRTSHPSNKRTGSWNIKALGDSSSTWIASNSELRRRKIRELEMSEMLVLCRFDSSLTEARQLQYHLARVVWRRCTVSAVVILLSTPNCCHNRLFLWQRRLCSGTWIFSILWHFISPTRYQNVLSYQD